jgi:hypothetical protein
MAPRLAKRAKINSSDGEAYSPTTAGSDMEVQLEKSKANAKPSQEAVVRTEIDDAREAAFERAGAERTHRDENLAQDQQSLAEFLLSMNDYQPIVRFFSQNLLIN